MNNKWIAVWGCPVTRPAVEMTSWMRDVTVRFNIFFSSLAPFGIAVRNSVDPLLLACECDSGDHLHPSSVGAQAMADSISTEIL